MKIFIKHYSAYLGAIMVASFLFLYSCDRDAEITRYLEAPQWMELEKVNSKRIDLRWESVEGAKQYVVYQIFFEKSSYSNRTALGEIEQYASKYEIARTVSPEYQYEGSYDPVENGYSSSYYCYFGVRVVDENGNMSRVEIIEVSQQ